MRKILIPWLLVTTTLVVCAPIAAVLTGVTPPAFEPGSAGAGSPAALLWWSLASNALIAAVLTGLAARSSAAGWTKAAGLFAVAFGLSHLAGLLEAWVFHVIDGVTAVRLLAMAALTSAAACAAAARLTPPAALPRQTIAWRPAPLPLAIVSVLYLAAYFAAGILVFPFVEAFYATRSLPPTLLVVALQLFVRGPLFGVILAWIVGSTYGSRGARAAWAGAALSIIGGVAPLLMPNPFFTDAVRWAHFVETSVSNLVFGALAGWILQGESSTRRAAMTVGERQSV